ncbi:hypothetical protein BH09PSE5_BH09PSE5_37320 [soil metagenome]
MVREPMGTRDSLAANWFISWNPKPRKPCNP